MSQWFKKNLYIKHCLKKKGRTVPLKCPLMSRGKHKTAATPATGGSSAGLNPEDRSSWCSQPLTRRRLPNPASSREQEEGRHGFERSTFTSVMNVGGVQRHLSNLTLQTHTCNQIANGKTLHF